MGTGITITNEMKEEIVNYYNSGHTIKETALHMGIAFVTAKKYLDRSGRKNRKTTRAKPKLFIDDKFFEKIDTHKKAQILGMIYADGCLTKNGKGDAWRLEIGLQIGDIKYIEQVKTITKNEAKVAISNHKLNDKSEYKIHIKAKQPTARWTTCNYKLCMDIQKLGIHPRKSFTLEFPSENQVPKEFINSFILGAYEGDGTFSLQEGRFEAYFSIIGNDAFVLELKNKVFEIHGFHMSWIPHQTDGISVVSLSGNHQVIKFMDWLYKDSDDNLRLDRKYNNYINFRKRFFEKQEYMKTDEFKKKICEKRLKTKREFNRTNTFNYFYIKDPNGVIYYSNKMYDFYKNHGLTPYRGSFLLNKQITEYKGWTLPTEEEIKNAKESNAIITEIFEPKRQERHNHLRDFYLKDYDNKIYFSETIDRVVKNYPNIERRFIVNTVNNKVWRKNRSTFTYPTNQEIEQAKQNNEIITLE